MSRKCIFLRHNGRFQLMQDLRVPTSLPRPVDDGAAQHLPGTHISPSVHLNSTDDESIALGTLPGLTIIFCYPRTSPANEVISSAWSALPGARGCTAEACAFRDAITMLKQYGVDSLFGLSTQSTDFQKEARDRLALPYHLLSDENLDFMRALNMPCFEWQGTVLITRCTLAIRAGLVEHVWYPVFPSEESPLQVIEWLKSSTGSDG